MALVMVAVLALVRQMDAASKAREQTVVENGVIGWTNEVAHMVVTQVVWDEAVRNLDNRFDPEWAKGNVGEFFYSVDGFERSFVLDDDNRPIYAADKGVTISPDSYARFAPATQSLVSKVRAGETLRGPLSKASDLSTLLDKPIQASTIAVVDDEPFNLDIVGEYLDEMDFDLVMVESGEAAWDALCDTTQAFDLVLLDRMMPGMDGIMLLQRMKADERLAGIPVIMQTAATSP